MSLSRKFLISSILMFVVPVVLIVLLSAIIFGVSFFRQTAFINMLTEIDSTRLRLRSSPETPVYTHHCPSYCFDSSSCCNLRCYSSITLTFNTFTAEGVEKGYREYM